VRAARGSSIDGTWWQSDTAIGWDIEAYHRAVVRHRSLRAMPWWPHGRGRLPGRSLSEPMPYGGGHAAYMVRPMATTQEPTRTQWEGSVPSGASTACGNNTEAAAAVKASATRRGLQHCHELRPQEARSPRHGLSESGWRWAPVEVGGQRWHRPLIHAALCGEDRGNDR
jgi:hypothetical protein